ncbi:MAG: hypothetical protein M0T80_13130 [Actinomycetota bacterium]|nr:hypothetical protein [Actinomycetota bacterium]
MQRGSRVPGPGVAEDDAERIRALPGRVPFVVPPTATKSAYLTNLVVRELWNRAFEALARADRVVLAGYPVIDLREPPPGGSSLQRVLVLVAAPHPSL